MKYQAKRVLSLLESGRQFTSAQIAGMVGGTQSGVRSRISELRAEGHAIYSNTTKNGKIAYRLGTPSKRMVKTAYAMLGSALFQ